MANIIPPPIPTDRSPKAPQGAGLKDYLKAAFFFRWNLLFLLGGLAGAAIMPLPDVTFPLVMAGELAYLTALTSLPRFRAAIDANPRARKLQPRPHRLSWSCSLACPVTRGAASSSCTDAAWRCGRSLWACAARQGAKPVRPKRSGRPVSIDCSGCFFAC